jgi:hypothetical protein
MVTISQYAIDSRAAANNVRVEYSYTVHDPIAAEDIVRGNAAYLTDGDGALADPKWGDDELCAALAAALGVDPALVTVIVPS